MKTREVQAALKNHRDIGWVIADGDVIAQDDHDSGAIIWRVIVWTSSFSLSRHEGWYGQEGDADDFDGLVLLMTAMDKAAAALNAAMMEGEG